MTEADQIRIGLAELGGALAESDIQKLVLLLELLEKWDKVYSLTSIPRRDWVKLHLLDCLAVLPFLDGRNLADVGSGAGFPGLVLAVARPTWLVTLVESNQKKASFLRQAIVELRASNTSVYGGRVEDLVPEVKYDVVISRAFSELGKYVRLAGHLCRYSGVLAAMKASVSKEELDDAAAGFRLERIYSLRVPSLSAERSLVLLRKIQN